MAIPPRKTYPELTALSAPVVDSDVVAVYRSPGPAKRTTATIFADYIKAFFSASGGSALVGFLQSGTGADARTVQSKLRDIVNVLDFGAVQNGTTQTATVQEALTALPAYGNLSIAPNVKFSLKGITSPPHNFNAEWRADDCTDNWGHSSTLASGERIYYSHNSSYDPSTNPNGGAVNEWRFTSDFHAGVVVDTLTGVPTGTNYLAPDQFSTDPVRVSYNLAIDQTGQWFGAVVRYPTFNNFTGYSQYTWRNTVQLNGIGTAQWTSVPAENTLITGATSAATGLLLSVAAGSTTVMWISGEFVVGEALTDNNETTSATVTSIVLAAEANQGLGQDLKRGNWSVGGPMGASRTLWTTWGKSAVTKTRAASQYIDEAVTNPARLWVDDWEAGTPAGLEVTYDVAPAAASRRLTVNRLGSSTKIGQVGAINGYTNFSDSSLVTTSAFNVATQTKNTTGDYTTTWTTAFTRADYTHMVFNTSPDDNTYLFVKDATLIRLKNDDRNRLWTASFPLDPASIADNAGQTSRVLVSGLSASAQCWATFSQPLQGLELSAWYAGNLASDVTGSISGTTLTVTAATTGNLAPGAVIFGSGISGGTTVMETLTGSGGIGTYRVNNSQTVGSTNIVTAASPQIAVRFRNNTGGAVDLASGTVTVYARGSGQPMDLVGSIHLIASGGDI